MAIKKSDLYSSLWASSDELRGGMFVQSGKFVESHGGKHRFNSNNAVNLSLN